MTIPQNLPPEANFQVDRDTHATVYSFRLLLYVLLSSSI
jgi:hypothetical protein